MGQIDLAMKEALKKSEYFADICNLLLFQGRQVQELGEKRSYTSAEFLSGMTAADKVKPVITMVVYTGGEPWEYPLSLRDVIDTSRLSAELLQYIPDTRLPILDVRHSQELDLLQTGLQQIFKATQLDKKKSELKEYILNPDNGFAHVPALLANVFEQLMKVKLPDFGAEEEVNMCEAIEQMVQEGEERGLEKGIEQGINQGRQSELQEVCNTLFKMGTDETTIATLLHLRGLEPKQAAELMKQCQVNPDEAVTQKDSFSET